MSKGLDCTSDLTPYAGEIKAAGYEWCGRYYYSGVSHAKTKLSRAEALHLSSMGLFLVAVFENAGDHAGYFSASQGHSDGMNSFSYAHATVHQPIRTPIYFAVDFDATLEDLNDRIIPYFQTLIAYRGQYNVGVYGSGFVCRRLKELGLVSFTWLAQSPGWAEWDTFKDWNLKQQPTVTQFGLSIDLDQSNGNGGGFQVE